MKKAHSKAGITDKHNINPKPFPKLPPRCERLATALLNRGEVTREQSDRVAPASNGPHYMMVIRRKLGVALRLEWVPFVNSDGKKSRYGKYVASEADKKVIREYFSAMGVGND